MLDTTEPNWRLVRSFKVAELPPITPGSRAELEELGTRFWMGVVQLQRGANQDALASFRWVLDREPGRVAALLGAGLAHLRQGRAAVALELARQALQRAPSAADAHSLSGLAAEALDSRAEAVAFLERAVARRPENQDYQRALRRVTGNPGAR